MSFGAITKRPAVLLAFGLCLIGVVVSVLGRLVSGPLKEAKRTEFTSESGAHAFPAFSSDGKQVAYSAHGLAKSDTFHIFVRQLSGGTPRQVTNGDASDIGPSWKPDGSSLAFLRVDDDAMRVMVVPTAGGEPRQVAEFVAADDEAQPAPAVAWTHDGKSLVVAGATEDQPSAISVVDVASATARRITNPAKDTPGDTGPAVSPDGSTIAFMRGTDSANHEGGDIYLCDRTGAGLRRLTFDDHAVRGIAWMPDGRDLVYSSDRGSGWRLYRLPVYGGTPRDLLIAGNMAQFPAISPAGDRLLFTERASASSIWRAELGAVDGTLKERPIIRSNSRELEAAYSPDGKLIANVSDQSLDQQIWVGDADGMTPRYQLTRMEGMRLQHLRWSPDGTKILYASRSQRGRETFVVDVKPGGKSVRLLSGDEGASWSHDGKSIYYESQGQIWKMDAGGGHARNLTERRRGGNSPEESVDGKFVYFRNWRSIWRVPSDGGTEEEVIVPDHDLVWSSPRPTRQGVYYLEWARAKRTFVLALFDFATQKSIEVLHVKEIDARGDDAFSISPDGKYVLYPKTDQNETNLVAVENFR